MRRRPYQILIASILFISELSFSALTVHHDYGNLASYKPHANVLYEVSLIELALQKTTNDYGEYRLVGMDKGYMTHLRAMEIMRLDRVENYIKVFGYNESAQAKHNLDVVLFPVYLGLLSYRSCFTAISKIDELEKLETTADFKTLVHAAGVGWSDTLIMRANGISVREIPNRSSIYRMLAKGRVDLFCRGINEALSDYMENIDVEGTIFDRSIAMYYPNPHFFHINTNNQELIERMETGLYRAFLDGSLLELWKSVFLDSVNFVNIPSRKIFRLENPHLVNIPFNYQQYDFINIREN